MKNEEEHERESFKIWLLGWIEFLILASLIGSVIAFFTLAVKLALM